MKVSYVTLLVLAATIGLLAATGPAVHAEPASIDDFDDNSVGDVWNESSSGTGASLSENNSRLEFHFDADSREGPAPPGAPFGDVSTGVGHECKVSGDFVVEVDFDVSGWPEENGVRVALAMGSFSIQRDWDAIFGNVYVGGINGVAHRVDTSATSGSLRLARMDSNWTASYNEGGGWQNIASGSGSEDPASLNLLAWTHDHLLDARPDESKQKDITVRLDNLKLESGGLTCDEVESVEFTQAIQELQTIDELMDDLEDDGKPPVPLIAGKPAAMRVYFDEVDQQEIRTVQVSGEFGGTETVTLMPGCDPEERRKQEGGCKSVDFYFTPPEGEFDVTMNVFDFEGLREHYDFTLTGVEADELALQSVAICDAISSPGIFPTWDCEDAGKLVALAQFLRKIAPTNDVSVTVGGNILRRNAANYGNPKDWWKDVVQDVEGLHTWTDSLAQLFGQERYYFGLIRPNGPGGLLGKASGIPGRGGAAKSVTSTLGVGDSHLTTAHEVGHMMGARHTNTGAPSGNSTPACYSTATDNSTDWIYADNNLRSGSLPGDIEVGFDVAAKKALPGDKFFELMGYCNPQWISPRTYISMLNALGGSGAPRLSPAGLVDGPFWLVAGEIAEVAEFRPLYEVETTGDEGAGNGDYRIEVTGPDSNVLFTRSFTPIEISARPEPGEEDDPSLIFSELIPLQDGAARIVVIDDTETEIGEIELGGDAPVVTISAMGGAGSAEDVVGVTWSAEDADSSEHTYWVDYSPDGGETWVSQGMGLTEPALGLDPATLAGSDNAVVRVIASDGVNSGVAVSAPFSVAKKLPQGEIIGPSLNLFRAGELVWLEAAAWDVDDGTLDDGSLTWSSNVDGMLGTGASLPVYDLSEGQHTITMIAEDSDGNEVSDSIVVTVYSAPLLEGEVAIKGDLDCDGDVDSVDALKGLQHNAGLPVALPDGCPPVGSGGAGGVAGDIDCDDDADSVDSLSILRHVAGLAVSLPPGCKPIGI